MPLGFFLSVVRPKDTRPNRLIWLTGLGGASLAAGTIILGIGLLSDLPDTERNRRRTSRILSAWGAQIRVRQVVGSDR